MGAGLWSAMPGTRARYPQGREAESTLDLWAFLVMAGGLNLSLCHLLPTSHFQLGSCLLGITGSPPRGMWTPSR